MIVTSRPPFLKSLLEAWQLSYDEGGWRALVPYWFFGSAGVGGWLAWNLPESFWDGSKPEVPIAVMAGVLTFDGLVLALSWSSFGKIFEIVGAGPFSLFLRRKRLLSQYLVTVGYVHGAQLTAITAAGAAVFIPVLPVLPWVMKLTFAASTATTIYAIKQGVAASSIMQDLIWQKSAFDSGVSHPPDLRSVDQRH